MKKILFYISFLLSSFFSFSQLNENFSDGDFTNNPTWNGDDSIFTVNAGKLQSNGFAQSDTAFLTTPFNLSFADTITWEFYVNLLFAPSDNNRASVFLVSDNSNLQNPLNGYYIRIGENGSLDAIKLYRQSGSTSTLILTGTGNIYPANPIARVKVVRTPSGNWTVYSDSTGGTNFDLEGTITDNTFSASGYFGVWCKYTSTNSKNFIFDDVVISGSVFVDTFPPALSQITVISSTQLDLKFSEFISQTTAQTLTNYSVNNGIGNPATAVRDAVDSSLVHLTFSNVFVNGTTNTITVSNIQDLTGNTMVTANQNFMYFVPQTAAPKDVLFNEFMADINPAPLTLPAKEYIELYNHSSKVFDLAGWKYANGTTVKILPSYLLYPDSFLILCSSSDTALFSVYGNVIGISSWPALVDGGDSLSILDSSGNKIDEVNYSSSWPGFTGGKSMELINPDIACTVITNWIASNDSSGGTPGKENSVYNTTPDSQAPSLVSVVVTSSNSIDLTFSEPMDSTSLTFGTYTLDNGNQVYTLYIPPGNYTVVSLTLGFDIDTGIVYTVSVAGVSDCSGNLIGPNDSLQFLIGAIPNIKDVIFNEFMAKLTPDPASLPDKEYIELYNNSSKVFNLSGWKYMVNTTTKILPSFIFNPNTYLILCSTADTSLFSPYGNVLGISWENLIDDGANLSLYDNNNNFVDFVNYSSSWNGYTGGKSMELKNPANPCSGVSNWTASIAASGGTPGKINSVFSTAADTIKPTVISVTVISQNQIEINFSETMDSASLENGNYLMNNGISITNATAVSPDFTSVLLDIVPSLDSSVVYTVVVSQVMDCPGNLISTQAISLAIGVEPVLFDVVINEIYADPDASLSSLPEIEVIELYNKTGKAINLSGCKFSDGSDTADFETAAIFPNEYLIVCASGYVNKYSPFGRTIGLSGFPGLNNAGDNLTLRNTSGNLIHAVNYSDDWYGDDEKKKGGWTLEMIDPNNPCGEENNWRASNDASGGTPGKINSVNGTNPDNSAPRLSGAFAENSTTVKLFFNEVTDSLSMLNATYSINNGINISGIIVVDKKTVQLNLSNSVQVKILYRVTVNGTSDCIGNLTVNSSAEFALAEKGVSGDIIINEILYDPRTGGAEFVEIYNNSDKVINLQNWSFARYPANSGSYIKTISEFPLVIFPKEYLLLTNDTQNIKIEYPLGKSENYFQVTLPSLTDSATVFLMTNDSTISDIFSYYKSMHFALLKDAKGVSLERIDFNRSTNDAGNWHSAAESVGWATPGYKNSQYDPSEGDGSAVSIEPEIFSPDNDGFNDVVNIHYKFESSGFVATVQIYDAKGRLIKTITKSQILSPEGIFTWDGISDTNEKARIGIYVIYFEAFDLNGKILHFKKTCVVAGKMN